MDTHCVFCAKPSTVRDALQTPGRCNLTCQLDRTAHSWGSSGVAVSLQALHIKTPAAAFIAQQVRAHPGEVTVLALGPLTNIAMALQADEGLHVHIVSS